MREDASILLDALVAALFHEQASSFAICRSAVACNAVILRGVAFGSIPNASVSSSTMAMSRAAWRLTRRRSVVSARYPCSSSASILLARRASRERPSENGPQDLAQARFNPVPFWLMRLGLGGAGPRAPVSAVGRIPQGGELRGPCVVSGDSGEQRRAEMGLSKGITHSIASTRRCPDWVAFYSIQSKQCADRSALARSLL